MSILRVPIYIFDILRHHLSMIYRVRLFNVGLHFLAAKVVFSCPSVDRFGKKIWGLMTIGQVKVYQISAYLVYRELRNATFEGKIIATSIKRPDSVDR